MTFIVVASQGAERCYAARPWVVKDNTVCVDWKELPDNACVKYDKQGDTTSIINATTGQTRAKMLKIVAGSPKNLTP